MATDRYMTPGSAVADKLQEILAQRKQERQQQLMLMLNATQAQNEWQHQQRADERADKQLKSALETDAMARQVHDQALATSTAESIGGGVDVGSLAPEVAQRQQRYGLITSLGQGAEGMDGSVQPLGMTAPAPSVLRQGQEKDADVQRRRMQADEIFNTADPIQRQLLSRAYGQEPVAKNKLQIINGENGQIMGTYDAGYGTGAYSHAIINPDRPYADMPGTTVVAKDAQGNIKGAGITTFNPNTKKFEVLGLNGYQPRDGESWDLSALAPGSGFKPSGRGGVGSATSPVSAAQADRLMRDSQYPLDLAKQITGIIDTDPKHLSTDPTKALAMKLNSVQGLNDLAISRSSLADDFEIKDADGSNIRVPARTAVRQALDTWRNKDKRARVKAGYGEALLRTQFGEAWERLPEVRRDALVNLLETAISMESTVLPPKR